LQGAMRNDMIQGIKDGANATLDRYAQMGMPERVIQMIQAGLDQMPAGGEMADVQDVVTFKPEYSWTYEIGAKLDLSKYLNSPFSMFNVQCSMFLTTVRDQQIARFVESGMGRMMVNAGRSRNWGAELSVRFAPTERLTTWADYGFTRATFTKYDDGSGTDYTGNYVPFIPRHTISVGADYTLPISSGQLKALTLGLNTLGAGRIYWTETNDASQALYFTFGAHALLDFGGCEINFWGRNLTDKHYHAFYFESMNRSFIQKGKPLQVGVDVNVKF
ncbi:MAG: TonB-dependent receptor, partial [Bacteroidaceae bacterium]|nr:TonB-dependent receptor [Bacteroidaceae bacterium]